MTPIFAAALQNASLGTNIKILAATEGATADPSNIHRTEETLTV